MRYWSCNECSDVVESDDKPDLCKVCNMDNGFTECDEDGDELDEVEG